MKVPSIPIRLRDKEAVGDSWKLEAPFQALAQAAGSTPPLCTHRSPPAHFARPATLPRNRITMIPSILLSILASVTLAAGQESPTFEYQARQQVRLELLVVRLPEARAIELQPLLRDPEKCGAAQEKILAMIGKKEAELVDWPVVTTHSGQRAVTENVHEQRYAIEFAPPAVRLSKIDNGPVVVADPNAPDDQPKAPAKPDGPIELRILGVGPSAFEKRDVGVTFEAEPTVSEDGATVEVQLAPSHTTLLGWRKVTVENGPNEKVVVEQPDFQHLKTTTNITLRSGRPMLLGLHKLQDQPAKIEVFIVTATVLKDAGAGDRKPNPTSRKKPR